MPRRGFSDLDGPAGSDEVPQTWDSVMSSLNNLSNFLTEHSKLVKDCSLVEDAESLIPRIIVVGKQSSGKSSLLAALTGQALPTGGGCITICATEVRMRRMPGVNVVWINDSGGNDSAKYILNNEMITKVHEELKKYNTGDVKAGYYMNCRIVIEIYDTSDKGINATFVDLPGVVDSQPDLAQVQLITQFIMKSNCLVVHVLSLAYSDLANEKASIDVVKAKRPNGKNVVTVFTNGNRMGVHPDKIEQVARGYDPNGILVVTRKSDRSSITELPVDEDEELAYFQGCTMPVGRDKIRQHLQNFTQQMIETNKSPLSDKLELLQQAVTKELLSIGMEPVSALHLWSQWQHTTERNLHNTIKGPLSSSYVAEMVNLQDRLKAIAPTDWKLPRTPLAIKADIQNLSGLSLAFTIGSEPLVKKYIQEAVSKLYPLVEKWLEDVYEAYAQHFVTTVLIPESPSYFVASGIVIEQVISILKTEMISIHGDVTAMLVDIHDNPRMLVDDELKSRIVNDRTTTLKEVSALLKSQLDPNSIKKAIMKLDTFSNTLGDLSLTEANELTIKVEYYFCDKMKTLQVKLFEKRNLLETRMKHVIIGAVKGFSNQIDKLQETDEVLTTRHSLKTATTLVGAVLHDLARMK